MMPFDAWHGRLNVASIIRCPSARPVPTSRIISIFSLSFTFFFFFAIVRRGDIDWSICSKAAKLLFLSLFFLRRLFLIPVGYVMTIREFEGKDIYIYFLILNFWLYSFRFLIIRVSFIKSYRYVVILFLGLWFMRRSIIIQSWRVQ